MLKPLVKLSCIIALFAGAVMAQPAQRIIIGFESPLTEERQTQVKQTLEQLLDQPLQLVQSSNAQRWIVALTKPLTNDQLQAAIANIQSLPDVRYAELDHLLHTH